MMMMRVLGAKVSVLPCDSGEFLVEVQTLDISATKEKVGVGRYGVRPTGINLDPVTTGDVVDVKRFSSELLQGLWALR